MAVSFVAGAQANNGETTLTATATATIPATAQAGDTAIFVVAQNSGANTFTPPAGWSALSGPDAAATSLEGAVFGKDLVAGDPGTAVSVTASGSSRYPGLMLVFRGTQLSQVTLAVATSTTASTTLTSPAITTTADNAAVVNFWIARASSTSTPAITVPANHTADLSSGTAMSAIPNDVIQGSHLTTPGVAGSYGAQTATSSLSATHAVVYTLAMAPSSATGSLAVSGSGTAAFTQSAMTVAASLAVSGSSSLGLSGSPTVPGSLAVSGTSSLGLSGAPAFSGSLAVSGSGALSLTTPTGGALALTGSSSLTFSGAGQLYVFTGPSFYELAPFNPIARWSRLVAEINYGETVWRAADGTWHQQYAPSADQLAGALAVYPGGRIYHLTDQQLADLTAGGYGGYITLEKIP